MVARHLIGRFWQGTARSLEVLDYKHEKTVELFKVKMLEVSDEEKEILKQAAEILNLGLD